MRRGRRLLRRPRAGTAAARRHGEGGAEAHRGTRNEHGTRGEGACEAKRLALASTRADEPAMHTRASTHDMLRTRHATRSERVLQEQPGCFNSNAHERMRRRRKPGAFIFGERAARLRDPSSGPSPRSRSAPAVTRAPAKQARALTSACKAQQHAACTRHATRLAAGLHDLAVDHDVHEVRLDVIQQPLRTKHVSAHRLNSESSHRRKSNAPGSA